MVTDEAINMLIQFGIFLATALTAIVAMFVLVTNRKKKYLSFRPGLVDKIATSF